MYESRVLAKYEGRFNGKDLVITCSDLTEIPFLGFYKVSVMPANSLTEYTCYRTLDKGDALRVFDATRALHDEVQEDVCDEQQEK